MSTRSAALDGRRRFPLRPPGAAGTRAQPQHRPPRPDSGRSLPDASGRRRTQDQRLWTGPAHLRQQVGLTGLRYARICGSRDGRVQINFNPEAFSNISNEAKEFLAKLLVFCADDRLSVEQVIKDFIVIFLNFFDILNFVLLILLILQALDHPWLKLADRTARDAYQIPTILSS